MSSIADDLKELDKALQKGYLDSLQQETMASKLGVMRGTVVYAEYRLRQIIEHLSGERISDPRLEDYNDR